MRDNQDLAGQVAANFAQQLDSTIANGVNWLRNNQHEDGHWVGFLKTNSTIEAEWILAMYFLGIKDDPKYTGVLKTIVNEQREDGSWEVYKNAPSGDISATVECYAALRVAGHDPNSKRLTKAREWILSHGGLSKVRVFTKIWLALIGEWPWEATPNIPPEVILLPKWFPINIYKFSSWGRGTAMSIALFSYKRPVKRLPDECRLDELFPNGRDKQDYSMPRPNDSLGLFFYYADKFLNKYVSSPITPLRDYATKLCIEWVVKRQEADGCWGGIQPPWLNAIIGLYCQGFALDHPVLKAALDCFNEPWAYTNEKGTYLQCCTSPVWDTVLSMQALEDCGLDGSDPIMQKATDYTINQQIHVKGDWSLDAPVTTPGGWAFEYENDNYPDIDDSAVAVLSLAHIQESSPHAKRIEKAVTLGINWIEAMRSDNGAWGAFDRNNDSYIVTKIPFSDFGEVLDPPSADVTAHVLEAYGFLGRNLKNSTIVRRAVKFLRKEQEQEGCWFGRWGVNYIYGTGLVLPGLKAVGEDMQSEYVQRAAQWLVAKQNEDGGWGETCASYMDTSLRGVGNSTASQTGWALMGLLALGDHRYDEAIKRGVDYLIRTQRDGTWEQAEYTGTGFPGYGIGAHTDLAKKQTLDQGSELSRGFMLNYAMYRHYFPMMALGRARKHLSER